MFYAPPLLCIYPFIPRVNQRAIMDELVNERSDYYELPSVTTTTKAVVGA